MFFGCPRGPGAVVRACSGRRAGDVHTGVPPSHPGGWWSAPHVTEPTRPGSARIFFSASGRSALRAGRPRPSTHLSASVVAWGTPQGAEGVVFDKLWRSIIPFDGKQRPISWDFRGLQVSYLRCCAFTRSVNVSKRTSKRTAAQQGFWGYNCRSGIIFTLYFSI